MSRRMNRFSVHHAVMEPLSVCCVMAIALSCYAAGAGQQPPPKQNPPQHAAQQPPPKGKVFSSPEQAAGALHMAAKNNDESALMVILGPDANEVITWTPDAKERQDEREQFAQKYDQMHRLVKEPDGTVALYVGAENWPLPIPIVEVNGAWYFNTELGKKEILFRRVGRNEVEALQVCNALVDAEKEFHTKDHQYTAKFVSDPGTHDGLFWESSNSNSKSLIGPYLAHAGVEMRNTNAMPYHGYYYGILMPSPAASATQNGATPGFAVLAFPAEYRSSGVMTFIVDENGNAREKDLGPMTGALARKITTYNAAGTWAKVEQ